MGSAGGFSVLNGRVTGVSILRSPPARPQQPVVIPRHVHPKHGGYFVWNALF